MNKQESYQDEGFFFLPASFFFAYFFVFFSTHPDTVIRAYIIFILLFC